METHGNATQMPTCVHALKQAFEGSLLRQLRRSFIVTRSFNINPLLPIAAYMLVSAKSLILIKEGVLKKYSYESRDYGSVDEKSLS